MKEGELEFISVRDDEESNNLDRTYVDPSQAYEAHNDAIGNWLFNQSKVIILFYIFHFDLLFVASIDSIFPFVVQDSCSVFLCFWFLVYY